MTTLIAVILIAMNALAVGSQRPRSSRVVTTHRPAAVLTTWFDHIQRDEFDSLPPLLAPGFLFISDGARTTADSFATMIKGLGITHPRVALSHVITRQSGNAAYIVYDRVESFESHGVTKSAPETGTMVLIRNGTRWRIALWMTTSPPR